MQAKMTQARTARKTETKPTLEIALKSPRKPGRQSAEVADQTKLEIIKAALNEFARAGFEAASLRDIATNANTTHGLIRHHFGSKEGVWQAVVDHAVAQYTQALEAQLEYSKLAATDPSDALRKLMRSQLTVSATRPEVAKLLMREGVVGGPRLNYILERLIKSQARLVPLLLEVQKHGHLKQFDPPMFLLFLLLTGDGPLALPALVQAMTGHDVQSLAFLERHIETLIETLLPTKQAVRR
jgi:TetR/AcrR family transcriptional regulator